jgi:hypothetical protein
MKLTKPQLNKINYEDVEREVVEDDEIVQDTISAAKQRRIIAQVNSEYDVAYTHNEAKRAVMLSRLKLYNNQRREASTVGDPLMFTVLNTILASLYDDRLQARWEGRGGQGDDDVEDNLNALANFDYDVMGKDELDYSWDWDACFFGRGLVLLNEFDRTEGIMAPVPEHIPAVTWIRDPRAVSVNGVSGKGSMRFGGYEVGATYWELKDLPGYFNIEGLRKDKEIRSLLQETREAYNAAQGRENFPQKEESLGKKENYEFNLLNWFTHIQGKKYLVTLGNNRTLLVRLQEVKTDEGKRWPILDRALYPMATDWDGVSIPDLTEDKQRARAVLLNIGLQSAKSDVTPTYLFDQTRIKNKNDLNFRINKFIGVDGRVDNAIAPVQKSTAHQYVNLIMDVLDSSAQRATATPEIQQGVVSNEKRTLGELNLVSSKVDTRYSMSAKIFGWSERAFWRLWYQQYKRHFKDEIDEKVIRIQGAMAPIWRPLTRENIIASVDPDVKIESKTISDAKRLREQQAFMGFASLALQDPSNNRRFIQKRLGKLQGLTKEEVDLAFPLTVDEIQAEEENQLLNINKLPKIGIQDDHLVHLDIHSKANQNAYSIAHMRAHKKLMVLKRNRPDLFQPPQPGFGDAQPPQSPQQPQQPSQMARPPT